MTLGATISFVKIGKDPSSRSIPNGSKCYFGIFKSLIIPGLLCGSEICTEKRKHLGNSGELFSVRKMEPRTLWVLCRHGYVKRVKIQRVRCLDHVVRIEGDAPEKNSFDSRPMGDQVHSGQSATGEVLCSRPIPTPYCRVKKEEEEVHLVQ